MVTAPASIMNSAALEKCGDTQWDTIYSTGNMAL